MKHPRKFLVPIDLSDSLEPIKTISSLDFLRDAEVHLVFVFQVTVMPVSLGELPMMIPPHNDRAAIQQSAESTLRHIWGNAFGSEAKGKIVTRCLFDENTKRGLCDYANAEGFDLIVMWARKKRGIFEGSFSRYVSKHTKAHTLIIKPEV